MSMVAETERTRFGRAGAGVGRVGADSLLSRACGCGAAVDEEGAGGREAATGLERTRVKICCVCKCV